MKTNWLGNETVSIGTDTPSAFIAKLRSRKQTIIVHCTLTDSWTDEAEALRDDWQEMEPVLTTLRPGTHETRVVFDPSENATFQAAVTANLALLEAAEALS